jgi:hypothetical protein
MPTSLSPFPSLLTPHSSLLTAHSTVTLFAQVSVAHSQLTLSALPGVGGNVTLGLSVGGQQSPLVTQLRYRGPSIRAVDVDPAASESDFLDCTQGVESVGRLNATLVVYGRDFGLPGAAVVLVNGERVEVDAVRTPSLTQDALYVQCCHWGAGAVLVRCGVVWCGLCAHPILWGFVSHRHMWPTPASFAGPWSFAPLLWSCTDTSPRLIASALSKWLWLVLQGTVRSLCR